MSPFASWPPTPAGPVIATAIHAGHDVRPEVAAYLAVDAMTRLREEDPATDRLAGAVPSHVAVHRSRFEVDLNRLRPESVYRGAGDAWGSDPWLRPLPGPVVEESHRLHDAFYKRLCGLLDDAIQTHGGFVLFDVHSYNHRRGGPGAPAEPAGDNPLVNLGTGSLPDRWRPVADTFLTAMRSSRFRGRTIDARENVKFEGRHLAGFVHERYGRSGCALAVEFRKDYVDEWTGEIDHEAVAELGASLGASADAVWEEALRCR